MDARHCTSLVLCTTPANRQAIQEATASEPLTLDEEYDNQASWRTSSDKLTFIVCEPHVPAAETVRAGQDDADARMRGDINFFLYPDDSKEGDSSVIGEVDVMVAGEVHRKQGLGSGAVRGLLGYLTRNIDEILEEYASGKMVNLTGLNGQDQRGECWESQVVWEVRVHAAGRGELFWRGDFDDAVARRGEAGERAKW